MSRNVILDDGFTRDGYIRPEDGVHGDLRFVYRPMLAPDVVALDNATREAPPDGAEIWLVADKIAEHLTSWSEVDADGKPLAIATKWLARLPLPLFRRLHRILACVEPSDFPPDPKPDEIESRVRDIRAKATGAPTGGVDKQQGN